MARLTKGIEDLPADQQKAEIEKRAAEHEASYKEFTKGDNKISDENSKKQRVSEFAGQTAKAMAKFLTPAGKKDFAPNKGAFENGSRIDENGKAISENDFVTLKEKVKQLRKEKNEAEIKKINDAPSAYLNSNSYKNQKSNNESTEKNNQDNSTGTMLEGVSNDRNQKEGQQDSTELRTQEEEIKLDLNFVAEKDLPKVDKPAKNKDGVIIGTKPVTNPALSAEQKAIKDKLETLKDLLKCLTKK